MCHCVDPFCTARLRDQMHSDALAERLAYMLHSSWLLSPAPAGCKNQRGSGGVGPPPGVSQKELHTPYQDEHVDQQDDLVTSMEMVPSGEQPSEQEPSVQEQEMPQPGEIDTPPQEAAEPMEVLEALSDVALPSRMPMEPTVC
jgi:hypothetical protein